MTPAGKSSSSSSKPLEPEAHEHGEWGYTSRPVGGFGEDYGAQVAHGDEPGVPAGPTADSALVGAVQKSLARAHVDAANVRVEVSAGHVRLFGSVHDESEKSRLEARARAVPGITGLTSQLSVLE
jgi:hypothetical protein